MLKIQFAKVNEKAKIPSKRLEDAAMDIYACFEEEVMTIQPGEIVKVPTGIASVFSSKWVAVLKERGSTGTIGLTTRSGVMDSGYRGEWFVPLCNVTNTPIHIVKKGHEQGLEGIIYPYEKAITQVLMLPVPLVQIEEISHADLLACKSERGTGSLGSSKK